MTFTKVFFAGFTGAIFLGTTLSLSAFFILAVSNDTVTMLGKQSDWWWLGMIAGAILGVCLGGIAGCLISAFELNLVKAILFGLTYSAFFYFLFWVYTGGGWDQATERFSICFIIAGPLNGAIVSLLNSLQNPLK